MIFQLFLVAHMEIMAQDTPKPRVLNFTQLEPILHMKNDTVYLINFWATWCAPCVKELPAIQEVEKKYAANKFKVILVSLDMTSQLNSKLIPFIRSRKITSEVVLLDDPDQNTWIDKIDKNWSGEIPFTVIYSKDFRDTYAQPFDYHTLDSIINRKIKLP